MTFKRTVIICQACPEPKPIDEPGTLYRDAVGSLKFMCSNHWEALSRFLLITEIVSETKKESLPEAPGATESTDSEV